MTGTYTARDVIFLGNDVVVDGIDSLQISLITRQGSHISHTGIHITGTNGVSPGFRLVNNGFVALRIDVLNRRLATIVQQELSLVQVFLLASQHIETSQSHLSNLMTRNHTSLSVLGTHLADDAIGITLGNVQELVRTCSLIMGTSGIHHVTQVIQLVAGMLLSGPTLMGCPSVRMFRIDGTGGIEVTVRLLGSSHDVEHGVDILLQLGIRIGLQHVRGTLDGLIDIRVVEREAHELSHIPLGGAQSFVAWMLQSIGSHLEVLVTMSLLAFLESQGNGHLTGCTDAVAPESVRRYFHCCKRHLSNGIAIRTGGFLLCLHGHHQGQAAHNCSQSFHILSGLF